MLPLVAGRVAYQTGKRLSAAAAALALASTAAADQVPAEIAYDVKSDRCPSREAFLADTRHLMLRPVAGGGRDDRRFRVVLADTQGILEIGDATHGRPPREFKGDNCAEVATAVAISLALAIDEARSPTPSSAEAVASTGPQLRLRAKATELPLGEPKALPEPPRRYTGVAAVALTRFAPYPAFGGAIFTGIPLAEGSTIRPQVHFALAYVRTLAAYDDAAAVQWSWYMARVALCAFHLGGRSWGVQPCISLDAGAIIADARVLDRTESRPWVAPGLGTRASWEFADFLIELGAIMSIPREYDFYRPGPASQDFTKVVIYRMPVIGATLAMGIAYRWR